jgi:hypothetical protein
VAHHVIALLARQGEAVAVVVRPRDLQETQRWARGLGGEVTVYAGDPGAVDLGLDGPEAATLQRRLTAFFHLEPPPLFGRSGRPLRAAREVVMFAAGSRPPARIVALSRMLTGGGVSSRAGGPAAGLRGLLGEGRTPLSRVLSGRGSTLGGVTLKTGVPVDPQGVWSTSPEGKLLHLLVLMHLSVDIRRFRSVASRRLVLTSAPLAAQAAVLLGAGQATVSPDLGDPHPPTLAEVDRALSGMLETIDGVDVEFLSTCRRHADEIGDRWTGGEDPVDVLASFTVTESRGGGERLARELGLPWCSTLDVLEQSLPSVVSDMRADIRQELEVETRDALLR